MAENQKDSVKKSFWQRNLFLLIVLFIIVAGGGGYLYQNNILTFQTTKQANNNETAVPDPCLLYTSPSPRDATLSRMPSSA